VSTSSTDSSSFSCFSCFSFSDAICIKVSSLGACHCFVCKLSAHFCDRGGGDLGDFCFRSGVT